MRYSLLTKLETVNLIDGGRDAQQPPEPVEAM
jgi:hypothetical protein